MLEHNKRTAYQIVDCSSGSMALILTCALRLDGKTPGPYLEVWKKIIQKFWTCTLDYFYFLNLKLQLLIKL